MFFLAVVSAALLLPLAAEAQAPNSGARNLSIAYRPGSATENGYADAQLNLTYWIAACSSGPSLLVQAESAPHMLVGPHRYWVDGRMVQVPPHITAPQVKDAPAVRGTVRGRGISKEVTYYYTTIAPSKPDCWFSDAPVAKAEDLWKKGATDEEKAAVLREIAFHPTGQFAPLRNSQVEEHFRAIWKQERADSVARAQAEAQARREEERNKAEAAAAERKRAEELERQRAAEAQKAAAAKASTQTSANGSSSSTASGSSQSGTVAAPPGVTAPFVRDNAGGYYQRTADGRYARISEAEYNAGLAKEREARAAEEAEQQRQAEQARAAEAARQAEVARLREEERQEAVKELGNTLQQGLLAGVAITAYTSLSAAPVEGVAQEYGLRFGTVDDGGGFMFGFGTNDMSVLSGGEFLSNQHVFSVGGEVGFGFPSLGLTKSFMPYLGTYYKTIEFYEDAEFDQEEESWDTWGFNLGFMGVMGDFLVYQAGMMGDLGIPDINYMRGGDMGFFLSLGFQMSK